MRKKRKKYGGDGVYVRTADLPDTEWMVDEDQSRTLGVTVYRPRELPPEYVDQINAIVREAFDA